MVMDCWVGRDGDSGWTMGDCMLRDAEAFLKCEVIH